MALNIPALQSQVMDPFQSALSGFYAGQQQRTQDDELLLKQQQAQEKKDRQIAMMQKVGTLFDRSTPTTDNDMLQTMVEFPELMDVLMEPYKNKKAEVKDSSFKKMAGFYSMLATGNIDMAKADLDRSIQAAEGSDSPHDAEMLKFAKTQLDQDPERAKDVIRMQMFAMDPDRSKKWMEGVGIEDKNRIELKQAAAQVGLTEAQAKQALANSESLSANTQKTLLEVESLKTNGEPVDPKVKFGFEKDLRADYNKLTGEFFKVQDAYRRVQSAEPNAAGDLALIFSFMKMLDPGSVVREGEFANAQNAAGVPDRVRNQWNKLMSGERLGEPQRKAFIGQTESLYRAAKRREVDVRKQLDPAIRNYDLNPDNVYGEITEEPVTELSDEALAAEIARLQAEG